MPPVSPRSTVNNANPNSNEENYFTAILNRDVAMIKKLNLSRRFISTPSTDPLFYGRTPLHVAVWEGYTEGARLLIDSGADINAADALRDTPFIIAISENRVEILQHMLKAARQVRKFQTSNEKRMRETVPNYSIPDRHGGCCIHTACERGHVEAVSLIAADIEELNKDKVAKDTAESNKDTSNSLDVNAYNDYRLTPLLGVVCKGGDDRDHISIVKILIEKFGVELNAPNADNKTALALARETEMKRIAKILTDAGATIIPDIKRRLTLKK